MAFDSQDRVLQIRLLVKWDGVNDTDETPYLIEAKGSEKVPDIWSSLSGNHWKPHTAKFTMAKISRYDPDATGSVVGADYGYHAPITFEVSSDGGVVWEFAFSGFIDRIVVSEISKNTVIIEAVDASHGALQNKISTAMYQNIAARDYVTILAGLAGLSINTIGGDTVLPFAWMDDENIMDEIALVAQSIGGFAFMSRDGILQFYGSEAFVTDTKLTTAQMQLTLENQAEVNMQYGWDTVYNGVVVSFSPKTLRSEEIIYSLSQPVSLNAGESRQVIARFRYPVSSVNDNFDVLVINGGGEDMSSSLAIARTDYAQRSVFTLTNLHATQTINVTRLNISGIPAYGSPSEKYMVEVNSPIVGDPANIKKVYPIRENPYIQTAVQAELLAEPLAERVKNMRRVYRVASTMRPDVGIFSRVSVFVKSSEQTVEALWVGTSWQFRDAMYRATYNLVDISNWLPYADSDGYFIVGFSPFGSTKRLFY